MNARPPSGMPATVRGCLVMIWIQALASAYIGWSVRSEIDTRHDHGQEVESEGVLRFVAYLSYGMAAALLVASVFFFRRTLVASKAVYVYEVLVLCFGGLGIALAVATSTFHPLQLVGFALPGAVCWALSSDSADQWFAQPSTRDRRRAAAERHLGTPRTPE
ncbi:hypothetical protein AB0F42_07025 [Streptomyces buecherae]|uniref:hypothetical protein n=1 Tax=Streptomyces buecherae TaxID=2763006 RepID=UPI0033E9DD7D